MRWVHDRHTLHCGNATSQETVSVSKVCEASAVTNCCCDEFYALEAVSGDINLDPSLQARQFRLVTSIGGSVIGLHSGDLKSVDFHHAQQIGGDIVLRSNPAAVNRRLTTSATRGLAKHWVRLSVVLCLSMLQAHGYGNVTANLL